MEREFEDVWRGVGHSVAAGAIRSIGPRCIHASRTTMHVVLEIPGGVTA
jgi:hypothetical protein